MKSTYPNHRWRITLALAEWALALTPYAVDGVDSASSQKQGFRTSGVFFDAQYLERVGVTLGVARTGLVGQAWEQNELFGSARMHLTPDGLAGRLTLRGDIYAIDNSNHTDVTHENNAVRVVAGSLTYRSFEQPITLTLGYADSRYGDSALGNPALRVRQLHPAIEWGLNDGADRLSVGALWIRFPASVRTQNMSGTEALQARWTHDIQAVGSGIGKAWCPTQFSLGGRVGRGLYGVDGEAATVYTQSDMQRGGWGWGAQWSLLPTTDLHLSGGRHAYEAMSQGTTNHYSVSHIYVGVRSVW